MFFKSTRSSNGCRGPIAKALDKVDDREWESTTLSQMEGNLHVAKDEPLDLSYWTGDEVFARLANYEAHRWIFPLFDGWSAMTTKMFHDTTLDFGPWVIEQRAGTEVGSEGPTVGLRYRVYYGAANVGEVALVPTTLSSEDDERILPGAKHIGVAVTIQDAPLIPVAHITAFLDLAFGRFRSSGRSDKGDFQMRVLSALTETQWESQRRSGESVENFR